MTGDQSDILKRLRLTLPTRWFGDNSPILDGILSGFAASWTLLYALLQFVVRQSRLSTATDSFLDLAAREYLEGTVPRRPLEADSDYRPRVLNAARRLRGTPDAIAAEAGAAGYLVEIFEAAQPASTGCYNISSSLAWNSAGRWGSMQMPLESLIVAKASATAYEDELWRNLAGAAPAGGALWISLQKSS